MIALAAITSMGCAELAQSAPALTIEGTAIERARATSDHDADTRWSWAVGVSLGGRYGEGVASVGAEEPPAPLVVTSGSRCRIAAACAWEARARRDALARARRMVEVPR
ncbi:hypothetical protein [Sandaracinus amylolyticus]|uniref:hypothetical protein n=1 Tax=Sandaracinus amylolyticus TaxID=927083 RepID=UPI00069D39A7|nr:hypothetical protein [Sandaracinus amylolyticus]